MDRNRDFRSGASDTRPGEGVKLALHGQPPLRHLYYLCTGPDWLHAGHDQRHYEWTQCSGRLATRDSSTPSAVVGEPGPSVT